MAKEKYRGREPISNSDLGIRVLIGLIFIFMLALFIHFREVRIIVLEVDKKAHDYVVASIDFSFPDPDSTIVLQQEALKDIGSICRIAEGEIERAFKSFEKILLDNPSWREQTFSTFEELSQSAKWILKELHEAKLTDLRTLKKRVEVNLSVAHFYILFPITEEKLYLPESFWEQVKKNLLFQEYSDINSMEFVLEEFKKMPWKISKDFDSQRILEESVKKNIPEKYTFVKAGSRIIDYGEKTTTRHIAMLSAMKQKIRESKKLWRIETILGSLLFSSLVVGISSVYLYRRQYEFFRSKIKLTLYTTIIALLLIFTKITESFLLFPITSWAEIIRYPIAIPFATILLFLLINEEISLFSSLVFTIIMGVTLAFEAPSFLVMNFITGLAALLFCKNLKKRKEIFFIMAKIWVISLIVLLGYNLVGASLFSWKPLIDFSAAAINLLAIAILITVFLPLLESIFNALTDTALMEYMDPTNELLRRLSIEAPGTYQHSLSLGHIAEYLANSIGANGLFCRVTTLFHDIGKLNTPHYYTENQQLGGGKSFDIHQLLTPVESSYIIKSHVHDGVSLAKQYKLPQSFIDIIQQHHGTTLIKYFYAKQLKEVSNPQEIDETVFRYPGPIPQTKEAAIIMIADSVEAASRSLEEGTEEAIRSMINKIVSEKVNDNQFDDCLLTFKELKTIKNKMVEILKATHHTRIKYPEIIRKET